MRSRPDPARNERNGGDTERESEGRAARRGARLRGLLVTLTLIAVLALIAIGIVRIVQS